MKIFEKIIFICAILTVFNLSRAEKIEESQSLFVRVFENTFFTAHQVLEAYTGAWSGTQSISTNGNVVATALVEQNYIPSRDTSRLKLIGSGKIVGMGASIPTRSFTFIDELGRPRLDVRTENDVDVPYVGFIDANKITWVPLYFFTLYDSQTDEFVNTADGVKLVSRGVKFVSIPQRNFEGYIEMNCELARIKSVYSKDKVKTSSSAKINFPKAKMSD